MPATSEAALARKRVYWRERATRKRREERLAKHGLTEETYQALFTEQSGLCAICGGDNAPRDLLCVDHCHTNGHVRGLLCHNCNLALGHLKDDPERALKAAEYLIRTAREEV